MWSWWYLQFGPQDIYPFRYLLDISIFYHILNSCRSPLPFFFEFPSGALAPPWKKWWCHRPATGGGFFMAFTARSTVPVNISPRLVTDHYLETKPSSRSRHIYLYPSKYSPWYRKLILNIASRMENICGLADWALSWPIFRKPYEQCSILLGGIASNGIDLNPLEFRIFIVQHLNYQPTGALNHGSYSK